MSLLKCQYTTLQRGRLDKRSLTLTSMAMRLPTLAEVLTNQAPPPYTLSAFMAFLSQNHCLETLEFTLDASRYQTCYYSQGQIPPLPGSEEANRLRSSWDRLINSYIRPGSSREVNLAAADRDFLLRIPNTYTPPSPEALDGAVYKITELMRDSVLSPFLQACQQKLQEQTMTYGYYGTVDNLQMSSNMDRGINPAPTQQVSFSSHALAIPQARSAFQPHANAFEQHSSQPQSGISQLFSGQGRKILRPTSARPTSVPSIEYGHSTESWPSNADDSDMSGSEDPITPPHTPPASSSPGTGGAQWKSKIKSQFSKINSHRAKSRDPN